MCEDSSGLLVVTVVAVAVVIALLLLLLRGRVPAALIVIVALLLTLLVAAVLLVSGVAEGIAPERSQTSADGSAFQATATLIADDAADGGTAESAENGTRLSIRPRGAGNQRHSREKNEKGVFHDDWGGSQVLVVTALAVLGIADGIAACGTECAADQRAFEAAAALRTDDAADSSTTKAANDGPLLSGRAGGAGRQGSGGEDGEDDVFHRL